MGRSGSWRKAFEIALQSGFDLAERNGSLLIPETRSQVDACRLRCDMGVVTEPQWGMFARASYWERLSPSARTLHILRGLQDKHPGWCFCGISAAVVYGLPVSSAHFGETHVISPHGVRIDVRNRVRVHVRKGYRVHRLLGVRVTSLERTVFDCIRDLEFCEALAVADACLRRYGLSQENLLAFVRDKGRGARGVARARRVLACSNGLSESWGESVARGLMIKLGFAAPELQVIIDLPHELGGPRRVDFLWRLPDGTLIIGEFDGKVKYRDAGMLRGRDAVDVLVEERQRESRLSSTHAAIVRFTYDDLRDSSRFAELLDSFGVPRAA